MYLRNVILAVIVVAAVAFAQPKLPVAPGFPGVQPSTLDTPIQEHYFANPSGGDSYINIVNDGVNGDDLVGPGAGYYGDICANVFVFDATDEQLVACCSCEISANEVVSLKLSALTKTTLTGNPPPSTTVKLIATAAGDDGATTLKACSVSTAYGIETAQLANGMLAWGTTLAIGAGGTGWATVETPFLPVSFQTGFGPTTNTEIASLANRCLNIVGNGSNQGQCAGCTVGALGASKM